MFPSTTLLLLYGKSFHFIIFFQAFCSSITGTLAHQAVLKGVGVGDETATVLAATLTWLLKGLFATDMTELH